MYSKKQIEHFWNQVNIKEPHECWEYQRFCTSKNYGYHTIWDPIEKKSKNKRAHRFAYEITFGEILPENYVCHSCDNPKCCNPIHLWVGNAKDNNYDCIRKNRKNYSYGEQNGRSKLTWEQVRIIREKYSTPKVGYGTLAKLFNVSPVTINKIVTGKTWKEEIYPPPHLKDVSGEGM